MVSSLVNSEKLHFSLSPNACAYRRHCCRATNVLLLVIERGLVGAACCWKQRFLLRMSSLEERKAVKREQLDRLTRQQSELEIERERLKAAEQLRYNRELHKLQAMRLGVSGVAFVVSCVLLEVVLCNLRALLGLLIFLPYRLVDYALHALFDEALHPILGLLLAVPVRPSLFVPSGLAYWTGVAIVYLLLGSAIFRQGGPFYVRAKDKARGLHLETLLKVDSRFDPRLAELSCEIDRLSKAIEQLNFRRSPSWYALK
eukprot:TRINITY_DN1805_c0_g1_i1.p1 TRINITY_DN1805_c0_g1~~TRINITY_DN1805_c0_g1_i1.p1  ORF type:complete len:258 (+),score=88.21 TRINITY_DN1805_c0_g1_i1:708-1481(+)